MSYRRNWMSAALVGFALTTALDAQTTWWVDASVAPGGDGSASHPFARIQLAIDAASNGDVVRVLPGTYYEKIDYLVKSIRVESVAGAAATTIHGNQDGSVVRIKGIAPVLEGFTIENGSGNWIGSYSYGGGVLFDDTAHARVENCVIRNNYAVRGDGVGAVLAHGVLFNCTIEDNGGQFYPGWCQSNDDGGGVWANPDIWLDSCIVRHNFATLRGGGVYGSSLVNCVVQDNYAALGGGLSFCFATTTRIEHNFARSCDLSYAAAGGADHCTLEDCQLIDNESWDEAGGAKDSSLLRCLVQGNAATAPEQSWGAWGGGALDCTAVDCWFEGNWVAGLSWFLPPGLGGGCNGGSALRCVFHDNRADVGAGICYTTLDCCVVYGNQGGGVELGDVVANSIVRANAGSQISGNGSVIYSNVQGGWLGIGNIDSDPLFWNADGEDFHLMNGSPCIDSGDPGRTDADGSRLDMGAYPYSPSTCLPPVVYCPAGHSADPLCTPAIDVLGTPRVGADRGCMVGADHLPGGRIGVVFFGLNGATQVAWGTSSSCVLPPRQRTDSQSTHGTAGACDGAVGIDFNSWLHAHGDPLTVGTVVWAQVWYRDPAAVKTTSFSDAVRFAMCP